ncbi:hypothetical protein [Rhodococcus maanshanensis]|uniref:Uncharacterized protein n=1 Tax=Rhodococcus maanshanensis TaxID=183556 RepID=A0A1H7V412_9NOCA|nr:hypothetical protein [Rhodococcus maanshanensis]SEM03854.1 hypothetical protein SAMN05444583_12077 [Rhodococcus maanshanensis]
MNTIARADSAERSEIIQQANSLWRRAGVRGADRRMLLSELKTELRGVDPDGHGMQAAPDPVSERMLRERALERGMCGRALRLELAIPAAVLGLVAGLITPSLVLWLVLSLVLSPLSAIQMGQYARPVNVSSGILGYLCALLFVWRFLHNYGDPRATSTVRWLAALLPVGAALSVGAVVLITRTTNFFTSLTAYLVGVAVVIGVVAVGIGLTVGIARFLAVRTPNRTEPNLI